MICLSCNKETSRILVEKFEENGIVKTLVSCPLCPQPERKPSNFPSIIVKGSKRGRGRPRKDDDKFKQYELTKEEIAQTQKLKPTSMVADSLFKRHMDNVDLLAQKKIARVVVGNYGIGTANARVGLVHKKLERELGTSDYTITQDDGMVVTAEVNH